MTGFRHDAVLYAGEDEFLGATVPFLHAAVRAGDPTLVLIAPDRIARLRRELGPAASSRVTFGDIRQVGVNPARIIPAWRDFVDREARPGRRLLAKGHPVGASGVAQVVEMFWQLTGSAADRQVDGARIGLTHVTGGGISGLDHGACSVHVFEAAA